MADMIEIRIPKTITCKGNVKVKDGDFLGSWIFEVDDEFVELLEDRVNAEFVNDLKIATREKRVMINDQEIPLKVKEMRLEDMNRIAGYNNGKMHIRMSDLWTRERRTGPKDLMTEFERLFPKLTDEQKKIVLERMGTKGNG